ncbi:MAG: polysaccharide deacetylase family protein, partial [Desulfovibrio sp.]|nr:polysaccharide deacetylase family protein [Desulfovibrio sp.]
MSKILKRVFIILAFSLIVSSAANARVVDGNKIMDQDMGENLCALTFDDGPSIYTPALLDMLASYGIKATFFLLGRSADYYPEITRRIVREGHEVGNHSWSHPNLKRLSTDAQAWQIERTDEILRDLGAAPLYMRPPYGAFDERTEKIAEKLGVSLILWSMDSYDWKRLPENYAQILSTRGTVYAEGELRGVFLFHDIHKATVDDL